MLFNSWHFLAFFVAVVACFHLAPPRARIPLLLAASCYFYSVFVLAYLAVLVLIIVIDYAAALKIEASEGRARKRWLLLSLCANAFILALFKYYPFLSQNIAWLSARVGAPVSLPTLNLILPIGLSFHTFQSMSYTIEVYRRRFPAERAFLKYALYVMFFPQLVAGPIERPQNLLPQFTARNLRLEWVSVVDGSFLILSGLFKKVAIADRLALFVDATYRPGSGASGVSLILGTLFFTFQIYCDFSGYSDIARGCARFLGVELMENFRRPYFATSLPEFWRRWHISLSTWFRDYIYLPLGGNRVPVVLRVRNIWIVFIVSGLWHGANWTFVFWGAIHGLFMCLALLIPMRGLVGFVMTFFAVSLSWVFFRAPDLPFAFSALGKMAAIDPTGLGPLELMPARYFQLCGFLIVALWSWEFLGEKSTWMRRANTLMPQLKWGFAYVLLIYLMALGGSGLGDPRQFIYFQF